jgi:hypothetical protein
VELQVASVYAVTAAKLDDVPVGDVGRFERDLHDFLGSRHGGLLEQLRTVKLTDELKSELDAAIDDFKATFVATRRRTTTSPTRAGTRCRRPARPSSDERETSGDRSRDADDRTGSPPGPRAGGAPRRTRWQVAARSGS